MIDINKLYDFLQYYKVDISLSELYEILRKIDINTVFEKTKKRFRVELWDKKSSINGANAKEILRARPYKIDNAFLVYIDDTLVYFQDHNPYLTGYKKMKKNEVYDIAFKFTQDRVKEETDKEVLKQILSAIHKRERKE